MSQERIELSLDPETIKLLRTVAIKKYGNLRSVSRLVEDLVAAMCPECGDIHIQEMPNIDIEAMKAAREKWIAEEIERFSTLPSKTRFCGEEDRTVICNTCASEFTPLPGEMNFCCACGGKDLRFMKEDEETATGRIWSRVVERRGKN